MADFQWRSRIVYRYDRLVYFVVMDFVAALRGSTQHSSGVWPWTLYSFLRTDVSDLLIGP